MIKKLLNLNNTYIFLLIFALFVLVRVPLLGYDIFNTDVWKWKQRSYDFGSGVFYFDFEKTIQKYHPGVTLMWIGVVGIKLFNGYYNFVLGYPPLDNNISTIFELHFVQKFLIVLVLGVLFSYCSILVKQIFGNKIFLLFAVFLCFEPFYMALTRVMHLEGLITMFMFGSFLSLIFYIQQNNLKYFYFSAFLGALAVLTKSSAVGIIPICFFVYLARNKTFNFKIFYTDFLYFVKWGLAFMLTYFIMWPAMWVAPLTVAQELIKGIVDVGIDSGHEQLYFGQLTMNPGFFYYFVVFAFKTSPGLFIGVILYLLFIVKKLIVLNKLHLYLFIYFFIYFIEIVVPSKKLDRYLLPLFPVFVIYAAFAYSVLFSKLFEFLTVYSKKQPNKYVAFITNNVLYLLVTICIAFTPLYNFYLFPDFFSYYNPMFGGLSVGINVLEPKWMIGHHEIKHYLNDYKIQKGYVSLMPGDNFDSLLNKKALKDKLKVAFPEKYYTQIYPFIYQVQVLPLLADLRAQLNVANYFIVPIWDDNSATENRVKLKLVDQIKLRGVPLYNVYEIAGK